MRSSAKVARDWVRAIETTQRLTQRAEPTLASVVHDMAALRGPAPALIGEAGVLSYAELSQQCRRGTAWAARLPRGTVVALLMPNQPEFVAIWLGLTQAGCVVALLNTNLRGEALAHCIRAADARHVIVDSSLADAADAVMPGCPDLGWWLTGARAPGWQSFALDGSALDGFEPADLPSHSPTPHDPALLIFSSGTTGLPKAVYLDHGRILEWSGWFAGMMNATPEDRVYNCLPLYHSTGGVAAVGAMLVAGGSVVLRRKFSASRFWHDVTQTGCTIFQYIGELCRYLLQASAPGTGTGHRLRLCCGNGLRGEVWPVFQERFAIPQILEFYAATEGLLSLYNCDGKPGAIGRVPPYLAQRFPMALLRLDDATGEPLRGPDGLCVPCDPGEPGEAVAQIVGADPRIYTDPAASARKVLRDVCAPGDRWFRSGDLLRRDAAGFYSFVDRLGDTFRWKGENVATAEVAAILAQCPGVTDAVVFGVTVPGAEGRAGMAALVVTDGFTLAAFARHVDAHLPRYAQPVFVRIADVLATTGTFKHSKVSLAREGYGEAAGAVWVRPRTSPHQTGPDFLALDATLRRQIEAAAIPL